MKPLRNVSVLDASHHAVRRWASENRANAAIWAQSAPVREATNDLLLHETTALTTAPAQVRLRAFLAPVLQGHGYRGFFVVAPDGTNLASSRDENTGAQNLLASQPKLLRALARGESGMSVPVTSDVPLLDADGVYRADLPTMFVGAPILDDQGGVIAAFLFRLDPSGGFTDQLQQGRIGLSGETYAFGRDGLLLSNSRFSDQLHQLDMLAPGQRELLRICVADDGPGIPADLRETVFEHFAQVDSTDTRETGGLGLGLFLARSIVGAHGGEIWIDDGAPGARVCFTIPAADVPHAG